jgi:SAM-dependent methyltransferase
VVALDLKPRMLKKAAQRCAEAGLANVTFREGNATELPFAGAAFDAVVTRLSVHHFDRPQRVIAEIFRVLRPGGSFVVADVISSEVAAEAELQNAIEILRDPSRVGMLPGSELTSLVRDAGFAIESLTTWDEPREFEEWMGIVNDASRVPPLRAVGACAGQRRCVRRNGIVGGRREDKIRPSLESDCRVEAFVARMSEAISGKERDTDPGFRFTHPGYGRFGRLGQLVQPSLRAQRSNP